MYIFSCLKYLVNTFVLLNYRPGVPNILFVITDGQSNTPSKTTASAKSLHLRNVTVFSVGVSGATLTELQNIATKNEYVYNTQDFDKLAALQDKFNTETCKGKQLLYQDVAFNNRKQSYFSLGIPTFFLLAS